MLHSNTGLDGRVGPFHNRLMPSRYLRRNFKPNTYHHIFNRGSFKQKIFQKKKHYQLLAYCLMPNHFHLLLLQKEISPTLSDLLKRISVTYAMYFQHQYQHSGSLFQGKFRSVQVYSDESLLYVSKYIHLNPAKAEGSDPSNYPYSSLTDYLKT